MTPLEPLTPEERELARLLGRPAAAAPPRPVDDAVLAAARAATGTVAAPSSTAQSAHARRPRARLTAVLGVAASVVFAVGIAWQLKFDDPSTASEPPAVEVASAPATPAPATAARPAPNSEAAPAQAAPPPARHPAPPAAPSAAPRAPDNAPAATTADGDPAPSPMPARPAPAAAPAPAPAPAPAAAPVAEERVALDAVVVTGSTAEAHREKGTLRSQRAAPAVSPHNEAPAPAAALAASADVSGQPDPAAMVTAVEADALLPRRQWIQRIRERRDAGDVDTARASLERYLQHYPEARVPRDLRALLDS